MLTAKWKCDNENIRRVLTVLALSISISMGFVWWTGKRKTGWETGGEPIWWNWLRPIHATVWALFAFQMWNKCSMAWRTLKADIWLGLFGRYLTSLFSTG